MTVTARRAAVVAHRRRVVWHPPWWLRDGTPLILLLTLGCLAAFVALLRWMIIDPHWLVFWRSLWDWVLGWIPG